MSNSALNKWACLKNESKTSKSCDPYDNYLREFNKGKSFEYSTWQPLVTYTNNAIKQDFVRYNNVILACKVTHVASDPPEIIYADTGTAIGVNSEEWEFVISQSVVTNNYYIDDVITNSIGIPILSKDMLDKMDKAEIPHPFISIDPIEIEQEDRNSIDILFSAVRKLQSEVAKMRNAFKYGMYSYTGTNTALSEIVDDDVKEKDALWSVDESDLSEISAYNIDFDGTIFPFTPSSNVDISTPGVVRFVGKAEWTDYMEELVKLEDAKLYLYMTSNGTDITINLTGNEVDKQITIKLDDIIDKLVQKYNIVVLISRKYRSTDDDDYSGFNYIWISVTNYNNGRVLAEGFYNPDTKKLIKNQYSIDDRYYISSVEFNDISLYKFNLYGKYQDLSQEVIPSIPNDTDYKYRVAHLTIRAVDDFKTLEKIQSQLPNNELIWEEANKRLWIKSKDSLVSIGGNSVNPETNTGMTQTEIIEMLQDMGIVYLDDDKVLQLSTIGDITFVNSDTNKAFKFEVNSEGDLVGTEVPNTSLEDRIEAVSSDKFSREDGYRGFISRLLCAENGKNAITTTSDVGLLSDRVKIGAVYCPLKTDTKFGCSHGFIELENTSSSDIQLEGVYLHYLHPTNTANDVVEHLPLKGVLKAGSTYLIRCKKYADPETNADVVINVDSFDQEWYINGELLDLSNDGTSAYAFALTYGNSDGGSPISATTNFVSDKNPENDKQRYFWKWYYIDSLILNKYYGDSTAYWGINAKQTVVPSNCIIKNTFELDPAKQAFQALTSMDSSRRRTEKVGNDIQTLNLDVSEISFPNSPQTYPIERFAPKSSKQKKNVSTDKTKLDMEKPNAVSCSFGLNSSTTRCFNWVSAGSFDEYVFLKNEDDTWTAFESYKTRTEEEVTPSGSFPRRKEFSKTTNNTVYARINGIFPGCNVKYTSHKCILDIVPSAVSTKKTYTYIVGRKTKSGTPDFKHCSKEQTFTLYPESFVPRIYQTSDQQGFHWIEYQVWSAAAIALNNKIEADCLEEKNIIPVLINTGDATQNGTRVNEWLDYFNGGDCLFSHLEQMDVVGNNDLCGADPEVLGTGDDIGKSNSFYFHVFHCYEVDDSEDSKMRPIIETDDGDWKYIPSLYYFDLPQNIRMVMVNSEITIKTCETWFKKFYNGKPVNIYTGWTVNQGNCEFRSDFTTIYTMLYHMLNKESHKKIVACHEMPFTVITSDNLLIENKAGEKSRSLNGTSLVGSHMNQMSADDKVGIYWFSRLLEHYGVKLCLGGHKHTYASTFPIRENYLYKVGETYVSSKVEKMAMEETLANDGNVVWIDVDKRNLSKFPLVGSEIDNIEDSSGQDYISPFEKVNGLTGGVTYFMCQATGYKLTSNKELPSNYQEFSNLIPKTTTNKADTDQQYPMFAIVKLTNTGCSVSLARVHNIFNDYKFTQLKYSKNAPFVSYIYPTPKSRFGYWGVKDDNGNVQFNTEEKRIIDITWN